MKSTGGIVVSVLALVVVVSGCSATNTALGGELVVSEVSQSSTPLFLSTPQEEKDLLPEEAAFAQVDPSSSRYQGVWEGKDVYLAVAGEYQVKVIHGVRGEQETWGAGGTLGNAVFGLVPDGEDDATLQYVPHGTSVVPEGWKALSDFIIVTQ